MDSTVVPFVLKILVIIGALKRTMLLLLTIECVTVYLQVQQSFKRKQVTSCVLIA